MKERKLPSDEEFIQLYNTMKSVDIAKQYDVSPSAVATMAKRLGLRKNGQLPTGDEFKELYFKYSRKELAEMFWVHGVTVDYRAKQLGIYRDGRHPEPPSGAPSKCPDKETLLNLLDK